MIHEILFWAGAALFTIGGVFDLLASIGMLRFPNFYVRLHAATIGTVYGAAVPLFGISLMALGLPELPGRLALAGGAFASGIILLLVAPVGSHVLAYAAHKSKAVEWKPYVDALEGDGSCC
ncbi:MAG: monovalent cation/H(+) antiporter subunit G [Desulfurococcaceae archaeon]